MRAKLSPVWSRAEPRKEPVHERKVSNFRASGSNKGQLLPKEQGVEPNNTASRAGAWPASPQARQAGQSQRWWPGSTTSPDLSGKLMVMRQVQGQPGKHLQVGIRVNRIHGQSQAWLWLNCRPNYSSSIAQVRTEDLELRLKGLLGT